MKQEPSGFSITFPDGICSRDVDEIRTTEPLTFDRNGQCTGGEISVLLRDGRVRLVRIVS